MISEQFLSNPLRIGSVVVPGAAVLAPMSGVTDVAFRRIAARFGSGLVVTEMVASDALVARSGEALVRAAGEGIGTHVVQLVGREPAAMAEAARLAEASGAQIVDINFGCPAKKVVGGHGGAALMREPELAREIVAAVARSVSVPVSVKMRLGWDRTRLNAVAMATAAVEVGARAITVHGRTRQDFYDGAADWEAIAAVVDAVSVPVIANGDIGSVGDARQCLGASRAAAVMIGRAALGQPWTVGAVAAGLAGLPSASPSVTARTEAILEHYGGLLSLYGRDMGLRHARKHLAAYADRAREAGFGLSPSERHGLVTETDPARVVRLLSRLYECPVRMAA